MMQRTKTNKSLNALVILGVSLALIGCGRTSTGAGEGAAEALGEVMQWLSYEGDEHMPHVVLISGDEEYRSEEALPQLAKILSEHHGFRCTVLFAQDPQLPGVVDPNFSSNIPGLHHLQSADLMILFTRFRALPDDQMKHIDDFLSTGKPVMGIRTSTHAFRFDEMSVQTSYAHYGNFYDEGDAWTDGFGRLVLGEHWIAHHGRHGHQSTRGMFAPGAGDHPILRGIEAGDIWGPTDVYGVRLPLPGDARALVLGQVVDRAGAYEENDALLGMRSTDSQLPEPAERTVQGTELTVDPNDPMMPIAWTKTYQLPGRRQGKAFTSTIGASADLLEEGTRRMLVNAAFWLLEWDVPDRAKVDLVGVYVPSRFAFYEDSYWDEKQMSIEGLK